MGTNNWNAIIYAKGKYVAVGDYRATATSTDGINWTIKEFGAGTGTGIINTHWNGITYANGKFVMVGYRTNDQSYIATSSDGVNWTATAVGNKSIHWQSVVYGNGKFVVVGSDSSFAYSTDGVNWQYKFYGISSSTDEYNSVVYGNAKFVAIGHLGRYTSSTDGITWTTPSSLDLSSFYCVTFGNGKYVGVGYGYRGSACFSSDGINWTVVGNGTMTNQKYGGIAYNNNGVFIAVGNGISNWGQYICTTDGENWTTPVQIKKENGDNITEDLNSVCFIP